MHIWLSEEEKCALNEEFARRNAKRVAKGKKPFCMMILPLSRKNK